MENSYDKFTYRSRWISDKRQRTSQSRREKTHKKLSTITIGTVENTMNSKNLSKAQMKFGELSLKSNVRVIELIFILSLSTLHTHSTHNHQKFIKILSIARLNGNLFYRAFETGENQLHKDYRNFFPRFLFMCWIQHNCGLYHVNKMHGKKLIKFFVCVLVLFFCAKNIHVWLSSSKYINLNRMKTYT